MSETQRPSGMTELINSPLLLSPLFDEEKWERGEVEGVIPRRSCEGDYNLIFTTSRMTADQNGNNLIFTFVPEDQFWPESSSPILGNTIYSPEGKLKRITIGTQFGNSSNTVAQEQIYTMTTGEEKDKLYYQREHDRRQDSVHAINNTFIVSTEEPGEPFRKTVYAPYQLTPEMMSACRAVITHGKEAVEYLDVFQQQQRLKLSYQLSKYLAPLGTRYINTEFVFVSWWKTDTGEIKLTPPGMEEPKPASQETPSKSYWIFDKTRK